MKLECINNKTQEVRLTVGKQYKMEKELDYAYVIIDNTGGYSSFSKHMFKKVTE